MKLNITQVDEKEKKSDKSKYWQYLDNNGVQYFSKEKFSIGEAEFLVNTFEGEYNGKKTSTFWISDPAKAASNKKPFHQFPPKKDYTVLECAIKIVGHLEDLKLMAKPINEDNLIDNIKRVADKIKTII